MILEELRNSVIETANLLPKYGLVWMAGGTVCARDPETGYLVVTPSGMPYEQLTPEDMIVTDTEMRLVDGKHRPSVALNLWTAFFCARSELHGLVHTHSPYATAFSVVGQPIPVITETMADWFGQPIPVTRYLSVEDPEFAMLPVQVMGSGYGVLLGQHGVITLGRTLAHALERAVTLEEASRTYCIARGIGTPLQFSEEQARNSFDYYHHRYGQRTESTG
ncbi:MAG TPA: class II aldolase/adducin family protein [Anaerolineales bacterium]|nr:class II aldolase/adducin family protein [Anaerolineales bacterium]